MVTQNKARFRHLVSFIPACPTSSNFPKWAIKTYDINALLPDAINPDSEDESERSIPEIHKNSYDDINNFEQNLNITNISGTVYTVFILV